MIKQATASFTEVLITVTILLIALLAAHHLRPCLNLELACHFAANGAYMCYKLSSLVSDMPSTSFSFHSTIQRRCGTAGSSTAKRDAQHQQPMAARSLTGQLQTHQSEKATTAIRSASSQNQETGGEIKHCAEQQHTWVVGE
ncbi:hypothetical protein COO60DRAFT_884937 [Scenedesmus sp. NREL 46B-D3]|nr:hypothetical protein COO60DRAFT_884937 [Scenedesmus sp. NREL 46B-D3]